MDASFHRFSCFPLLTLALALSGCQTSGFGSYSPPAVSSGPEVFNAVLNEPPEPNLIVRKGDQITYAVITPSELGHRYMVRFISDCSQPTARMLFYTSGGMKLFSDGSQAHPEEIGQLPSEQKKQYLQGAQLKQACAQTALTDWRVVATPDHQDWQLIDRASLKVKGDEVIFWSARVPAREMLTPDRTAVYKQSRQWWRANCSHQQLTLLSDFYFGADSYVIGSTWREKRVPKSSSLLQADERQLFQLACGKPQSLDQYPHYEGRKQSGFELPPQVIAAPVLKAIKALNMPAPQKSIQHLRLASDDMEEAKRSGLYNLMRWGRDSYYESSGAGKLLIEHRQVSPNQEVDVSFRGLITLSKSSYYTPVSGPTISDRPPAIDLRFKGDWAKMPVGAQLRYTLQISFTFGDVPGIPLDYSVTCNVESQQPASDYYPNLTGNAKVLSCTGKDYDWGQGVATYAYLEVYGLFVPLEYVGNGPPKWYGKWTIKSVE
ncbi:hypothetical protein [Pseudomonas sp. MWU12-2345]|uniref:hypothetical protein n=1 Tax=Pseudomonas sp. MWU12-2345 TaxID=2928689 RepID=UPI00200D4045|nr:hypothetical protein [Pseudomonas sp. MWU12-2345]